MDACGSHAGRRLRRWPGAQRRPVSPDRADDPAAQAWRPAADHRHAAASSTGCSTSYGPAASGAICHHGRSVGCALNNDSGKRIANMLSGCEALDRAVERPSRLQRHGGAGSLIALPLSTAFCLPLSLPYRGHGSLHGRRMPPQHLVGRIPSARTIARLWALAATDCPGPRHSPWQRSRLGCRSWSRPGR